MFMEDLGPSVREADDLDGVAAAVVLHGTRTAPPLPVLDQDRLRTLPARALEHLERLRKADRWQDADDVEDALDRIAQAAEARSAGAMLEPFGWVHSEFHPTSLHIGERGWRLLDFARAFTGPGLLDLASWHGTIEPPHPVRLRVFLEQYVTAGGTPDALARAAGSPPRPGPWAGTACGPLNGSWSRPSAGSTTRPPTPPTSRPSAATSPTSSTSWRSDVLAQTSPWHTHAAQRTAAGLAEPLSVHARMEWTTRPGQGPGAEILGPDLRGKRLLELGCGPGHNAAHLATRHSARVTGVDLVGLQVRRARSHYGRLNNLTFVAGHALHYLHASDEQFDAIYSVFGAIGLVAPELLLPAIAQRLAPGRVLASLRPPPAARRPQPLG